MSKDRLFLKVQSDTSNLSLVREIIDYTITHKIKVSDEDICKITVAIDEALTYIYNNSYTSHQSKKQHPKHKIYQRREGDMPHSVDLALEIKKEGKPSVVITLTDRGKGCDINFGELPSLEEVLKKTDIDGLRLVVIKNFMDSVRYFYEGGVGYKLEMVKYLKP